MSVVFVLSSQTTIFSLLVSFTTGQIVALKPLRLVFRKVLFTSCLSYSIVAMMIAFLFRGEIVYKFLYKMFPQII